MIRTFCGVLFAVLPAFANTTLNLSEDLVTLRIASSNMMPNQPVAVIDRADREAAGLE